MSQPLHTISTSNMRYRSIINLYLYLRIKYSFSQFSLWIVVMIDFKQDQYLTNIYFSNKGRMKCKVKWSWFLLTKMGKHKFLKLLISTIHMLV